jgi:hypothetical protein
MYTIHVNNVEIVIHEETVEDVLNQDVIQWTLGLDAESVHARRHKIMTFSRMVVRTDSVSGLDGFTLPSPYDPPDVIRAGFASLSAVPVSVFKAWREAVANPTRLANDPALLPAEMMTADGERDPE